MLYNAKKSIIAAFGKELKRGKGVLTPVLMRSNAFLKRHYNAFLKDDQTPLEALERLSKGVIMRKKAVLCHSNRRYNAK